MAKKRPSPVALVQSYFVDGPGAESAGLLASVTAKAAEPVTPSLNGPDGLTSDSLMLDSLISTPSDRLSLRLADGYTVEQCDSNTVSQSNGSTAQQSDRSAVTRPDSATVVHADYATVTPLNTKTVQPSAIETITPVSGLSAEPAKESQQQDYQTVSHQTGYQAIPLDVLTLPYNQACVLEYMINAGGVTNARAISDATGIGIPSVRDAISRLIRRGFLPEPVTIRNATFQGFSYVLNQSMVGHFKAAGGLEQKTYKQASDRLTADRQTVYRSHSTAVRQSDSLTPISSSRIEELTTTPACQAVRPSHGQTETPFDITPSEAQVITPSNAGVMIPSNNTQDSQTIFVLMGPTGMFWEGEGLQERQAKTWCEQFEVDPLQMKQQLEWARFDLVNNNKAAEVRKDPVSWFFGVLRQTGGCYPKPANYKSPAEIRAEQMEQAARDAAEARERQVAAEHELAFQKLMSNPDSEEYRRLLANVDEFAKDVGGKVLETALREAFRAGAV